MGWRCVHPPTLCQGISGCWVWCTQITVGCVCLRCWSPFCLFWEQSWYFNSVWGGDGFRPWLSCSCLIARACRRRLLFFYCSVFSWCAHKSVLQLCLSPMVQSSASFPPPLVCWRSHVSSAIEQWYNVPCSLPPPPNRTGLLNQRLEPGFSLMAWPSPSLLAGLPLSPALIQNNQFFHRGLTPPWLLHLFCPELYISLHLWESEQGVCVPAPTQITYSVLLGLKKLCMRQNKPMSYNPWDREGLPP